MSGFEQGWWGAKYLLVLLVLVVDLLTHRVRVGQFAVCQGRTHNRHRNANSDMHRRLWDHPFVTAGFVVVVLLPMILAIGIWATPKHGSSATATPDVVMTDRMPVPSVGSSIGDIVARPAQPMIGSYVRLMLLLCGDVSLNPGPRNWKCPCGVCHKPVKSNQQGLQCDSCDTWSHLKCLPEAIRVNNQDYARLAVTNENWYCFQCQLPMFTDSFFSSAESPLADVTNEEGISTSEVIDIFNELRSVRKKCPKNIMVSHLKGGVKRLNNHSPNIRTYNLQHLSP